MAEYINIKGQNVEVVASDPANPTIGQIWYNSTSNTLKGEVYAAASFASAANLNTSRGQAGGTGTTTSALYFGGGDPGFSPAYLTATEEYDGSSWTSSGSLGTARYLLRGLGTQTASVAVGGFGPAPKNNVEEYNGSTWTAVSTIPYSAYGIGCAGTETAGLIFGGYGFPFGDYDTTHTYDGTTWTLVPATLPQSGQVWGGLGTQTAALAVGISNSGPAGNTTIVTGYDGSTWTAYSSKNTPVGGSSAVGIQTSALSMGGNPAVTEVESWDGSTWSISPAVLNTGRSRAGQAGKTSNTNGIIFGGITGASTNFASTEEYIGAGPVTQTITSS